MNHQGIGWGSRIKSPKMEVILKEESTKPLTNTNTMEPLDLCDLAVTWPIWRQQFEIYLLATHDEEVSGRRKLAIFLNCLGSDGIALANKLLPELKEFNSVAAHAITFEQLWSLFDDMCTNAVPAKDSFAETYDFYEMIKNRPFEDISEAFLELLSAAKKCGFRCHVCQTSYTERIVRDQLMRVIPEEEDIVIKDLLTLKSPDSQAVISKYNDIQKDRDIWSLVIPYLSLCDMEAFYLSCPAMKQIVQWFMETHGEVQIKQCCLAKYRPESSAEFYEKYGANVRILKLTNIPESDLRMIIPFFAYLEGFKLQDIQIWDSVEGFPTELVDLQLINVTMELALAKEWLSRSYSTLASIEVENFNYSFYASSRSRVEEFFLSAYFRNLKIMVVKGEVINIDLPSNLEFLKFSGRELISHYYECPKLQQLYLDVDYSEPLLFNFEKSKSSLVSLTIKNWNPSLRLSDFKNLKELKITSPVSSIYKPAIEGLNIKTTIVEYEPNPIVPDEPNLIFDMLNEYCILEIMDYLRVTDWMTFAQLHPMAERAAASYKYPRQYLTSDLCHEAQMLLNMDHFEYICGSVKTFCIDINDLEKLIPYYNCLPLMTALKSFELAFIEPDVLHLLPDKIEKLELTCDSRNIDLTPYFKRLAPNLKILKLRYLGNNERFLAEPNNLRELDLYAVRVSIPMLTNLLERNCETLENLRLFIGNLPESGWVAYEGVLRAIGSMGNLKTLKIERGLVNEDISTEGLERGCHLFNDMFKKIGRQLTKLTIDVYGEEMVAVLDREELMQIPEIEIHFLSSVSRVVVLTLVSSMKNLRKFGMIIRYPGYIQLPGQLDLEIPELMSLLEALPYLTHLNTESFKTTIKFGLDLKEYLKQKNRELWINDVKIRGRVNRKRSFTTSNDF